VAGIPTPPLLEIIQARHPGQLNLYVAECRPYEMQVARAIAAFPSGGIHLTVVTDNMISALIETFPIHAVWSQYLEIEGEHAVAVNGAHMAALLARPCGIPCFLHPISNLPTGESGRFAGEDITVPGSAYIAWELDIVPLELITEVIEPGSVNS
jgi:methylthioribose-1-phosphate isomerase